VYTDLYALTEERSKSNQNELSLHSVQSSCLVVSLYIVLIKNLFTSQSADMTPSVTLRVISTTMD